VIKEKQVGVQKEKKKLQPISDREGREPREKE